MVLTSSPTSKRLALVHFLAQRKHFLWDTLDTFGRQMGHNSSATGHKTTPRPKWLRLSEKRTRVTPCHQRGVVVRHGAAHLALHVAVQFEIESKV